MGALAGGRPLYSPSGYLICLSRIATGLGLTPRQLLRKPCRSSSLIRMVPRPYTDVGQAALATECVNHRSRHFQPFGGLSDIHCNPLKAIAELSANRGGPTGGPFVEQTPEKHGSLRTSSLGCGFDCTTCSHMNRAEVGDRV